MKLSSKALACGQSPMRKFHPYAVAAAAAGKKIYHLNIGQPDIHTPDALYDAIHNFRTPVLAYAASPGIPELIEAIERYYRNIGVGLDESDILITTGGSEALQSNIVIAVILTQAAEAAGIPAGAIQFVDSSDRQAVTDLIKMNGLVDVVIPRGGAGLIQAVVQNATVPVIETGIGVCHTYVDAGADYDMARAIAINAKVQRPAVCNAMETLLVHEDAAAEFLPQMLTEYFAAGVTIIGCGKTQAFDKRIQAATEADWATEYGDLRLSVKIVSGLEEALAHIAKYGTKHSECIVTSDYNHARTFQQRVDAAAVYVNASTRFTDGFEFGFGAEIGISTQKLHARGPMALPELTSSKYLISGDGQIRG